MKKHIITLLAFCASLSLFSQSRPLPFSPEAVKGFADSLYEDGFYGEAEKEYKRYIYSGGLPDETVVLPLLNIYNAQDNKTGFFWLKNRFYETSALPVKEKMILCEGRLLFLERNRKDFSQFYEEGQGSFSAFNPDLQNLLSVSSFLLNQDFSGAAAISREAAVHNEMFIPLFCEAESYSAKTPALAVFLSALVPGLGKLYGGTASGFFTDFTSVGLCAAACACTGVKSEWKDWRPYVFAGMGAVLFAVDLYGSFQNIKRVNAAKVRKVYEEADRLYEKMY